MSVQLGNLAISAGKNTQFSEVPHEGVKAILIGNESGLTVTITMQGGNVSKTLYPSTVDWFAVKKGFTGIILINPTAILNNTATWPSSSLIFDAIGIDDPEQASMYPISLTRTVNQQGATPTSTATNLVNTGKALNTNVIQVQPSGDAANTFSVDNAGNVAVGDATNGGSFSVVGTATFQGGIQGPSSANLVIDTQPSTGATVFQIAGVQRVFIDQNGLHVNVGSAGGGQVTGANSDLFVFTDTAGKFLNLGAENVTNIMTVHSTSVDFTQKLRAPTTFDLVLDTQTSPSRVRLNNLGTTISQVLPGGLTAEVGQFQPNMGSNATFNGSVNGTATFWTPIWGTALKIFVIQFAAFRTAVTHQFLFPSAISNGAFYLGATNTVTVQFMNGAATNNVSLTTSLAAAGGGTTKQATAPSDCIGQIQNITSDRIQLNATSLSNNDGTFVFIGV